MATSKKPKLAVWQPFFGGGGAEAVALWSLEALQEDFTVSLYTLADIDFVKLNTMYGTHLSEEKIEVIASIPGRLGEIAYSGMTKSKIVRMCLIYLTIQNIKKKAFLYDTIFSTFNALDMGITGLQYLHWVHVVEKYPENAPFWHRALMNWTSFSHERLKHNLSIANSFYTANQVKETYSIDSVVIYPPVVAQTYAPSWEEKENAFLCSGRLVKAKSPHRVINVLRSVRDEGFDLDLYITGGGGGIYASEYQKYLQEIVQQNSDWVHLYQDLPYDEYLKIMAKCRYGIHWKPEPFGISVAEMVKSGMIPFVRSKGGQIEIIGEQQANDLSFSNDDEAVQKVIEVLSNESLQKTILQSLEKRKELFTTKIFMKKIRDVIDEFIESP